MPVGDDCSFTSQTTEPSCLFLPTLKPNSEELAVYTQDTESEICVYHHMVPRPMALAAATLQP